MAINSPYPALPFENHTWRISHHTGVIDPNILQSLLFAASTYQDSRDPAAEITNYIVNNELVPPNIRRDSGQPDVWRDYQQILTELGLIFPTRSGPGIRLTTMGLAFLDGSISFKDLITTQAFKMQYPNGHHRNRSAGDPSTSRFSVQQRLHGILVRPAVLLWQVLLELRKKNSTDGLSAAEIDHLIMPARTNNEVDAIARAIVLSRSTTARRFPMRKQRRNALDWIKLLSMTAPFTLSSRNRLELSEYSIQHESLLEKKMLALLKPSSFYLSSENEDIEDWYLWYGSIDASPYPVPEEDDASYPRGPEPNESSDTSEAREIHLSVFQPDAVPSAREETSKATISSV
jgi:hypothetical protein